jgi:heat-inducible transcriptional repressor
MKMDERKQRILQALILDYIATGDPVGSRTIAKKYKLGVSSATIRNEMADLEEMGLIEQPHTSAGRVPSQGGYRYYVDRLMEKKPLPDAVKGYIEEVLLARINEIEALIQVSSKLLSQLTNYTALVMAPTFGKNKLRYIQLLPLGKNKVVLVIVLDNGHVEHRTLELSFSLREEEFQYISHALNSHLQGLSLEQWKSGVLQAIYYEFAQQKRLLNEVIELIKNALSAEYDNKVYLGGTLNILDQPEFKDVEKVKELLELLEEEQVLKDVLNSGQGIGLAVKIGTENSYEGMKDCSLITATYELDGKVIGTLGVLGPTRMEYANAVSIVEFLTSTLAEGLRKL